MELNAPPEMVSEPTPRAAELLAMSEPALMVVPPAKVLAPERVSVLPPDFERLPVPETIPESERLLVPPIVPPDAPSATL